MNHFIDLSMLLLILTNFLLLGSSRLRTCIRLVAFQGVILGLLPFFFVSTMSWHTTVIALLAMTLKGGIFPWLLLRALGLASVRREEEPFVGYSTSLLVGVAALLASLWFDSRLGLRIVVEEGLAAPLSFFTILVGLFLLMTRKKALTQILGYLVLENGIYAFGISLVRGIPFSVELGVLLDVWVAVFVMVVATYHISRQFEHTDVDKLNRLKG